MRGPLSFIGQANVFVHDTLFSKIICYTNITMEFITMIQFILPLCTEELPGPKLVESVHYVVAAAAILYCCFDMTKKYQLLCDIDSILTKGIFETIDLTSEQLRLRENAEKKSMKLSKILLLTFISAVFLISIKPLFSDRVEHGELFLKAWTPFELNSFPRYLGALAFQFIFLNYECVTIFGVVVVFETTGYYLCAELEILALSIDKINFNDQNHALMDIKKIYQHHLAIIKCFKMYQNLFNYSSAVFTLSTIAMLCTILFMFTDKEISLQDKASFVAIISSEMTYCILFAVFGQMIRDKSMDLGNRFYKTEWYTQKAKVQKAVLMMLIGTSRPIQLRGANAFKYTLEGLKEILNASYTYFNFLGASRH